MQPPKFRFSIRGILLVTGLVAIGLAAMANPNKLWMGVTYGIALLFLFGSILGVIYRTERARAFWTGFAVFGIGYLAIIFGPFTELASKLPTTMVLDYAQMRFHSFSTSVYPAPGSYYPPTTTYYSSTTTVPTSVIPTAVNEPEDEATEGDTEAPSTDASPQPESALTPTNPYAGTSSTSLATSTSLSPSTSFAPSPSSTPSYVPAPVPYTVYPGTINYTYPVNETFSGIGQAVCAMLLAGLGGLIAQVLFAMRQV